MKAKTVQEGVTFTFDKGIAVDIDVKPGIKEVTICYDLQIETEEKSFPDVESLVITSYVNKIEILNTLFPNVKAVQSYSLNFIAGPYLIYKDRTLLNTFCKDEEIDLKYIVTIENKAFYKCKSLKIKNSTYVRECKEDAFTDSALMEQPFIHGVKMLGNIVIAVDETAEEVVLPDEDEPIQAFADNVNLSKVKKLVIHNEDSLSYSKLNHVPPYVVLDANKIENIDDLLHLTKNNTSIHQLKLTDKVTDFKEIDGVIYDRDVQILIASPIGKEFIQIPETVQVIANHAFERCYIKLITLPDSIKEIKAYAFYKCQNLEHVNLGKGLVCIGNYAFAQCEKLKNVELPPCVKVLRRGLFACSGLESVKLNEGLQVIEIFVFEDTNLTDIHIPASVKRIEFEAFGTKINNISFETYFDDIFTIFANRIRLNNLTGNDYTVKLECNNKIAYVPRYVKPAVYDEINKQLKEYFSCRISETCEFWPYACSTDGKDNTAIIEYEVSASNTAKKYLKQNAKRIIFRLIEEGNEEKTVRFLKLGLVSKTVLEALVSKANELNQMTVEAYLLELLRGECNHDFSL